MRPCEPLGIRVCNWSELNKVQAAVVNKTLGRLRVSAHAVGAKDTDMIYDLSIETKDGKHLTKPRFQWALNFIEGFICGLRAQ